MLKGSFLEGSLKAIRGPIGYIPIDRLLICYVIEKTKGNPNNTVNETLVAKMVKWGAPTHVGTLIWNGPWLRGPLARNPINASGFPSASVIQRASFHAQGPLGSFGALSCIQRAIQ